MRDAYPAELALRTERIRGSGDLWVAENIITYDGTKTMHTVNIMEFRDGKVKTRNDLHLATRGSRRGGGRSGSIWLSEQPSRSTK